MIWVMESVTKVSFELFYGTNVKSKIKVSVHV